MNAVYGRIVASALTLGVALVAAAGLPGVVPDASPDVAKADRAAEDPFRTSDRCLACHKGVTTSRGLDVSIGYDWRGSMMANSARDPYWQAAVRREVMDHPEAAALIEDKCSRCHMPMASVVARSAGRTGSVFENLPVGGSDGSEAALAADGVSCSVCHELADAGLGSEESFTGGFEVGEVARPEDQLVYGPFEPDSGSVHIMRSATGLRPGEGLHVQTSELCATCHTLFTHSVRAGGEGPEFPEQVPYLEWRASSYAGEGTTCQDCHMPTVEEEVPVTAVLGRARPDVSRHVFRGGNFFMLRLLNRYRTELGVTALPQELALAADRTEAHLREATVAIAVGNVALREGRLTAEVEVRNLAGHKFPTAYPSRRAWLHVRVTGAAGELVFESGAFAADGRIVGNDNDEDAERFETHYPEISRPDQVQVYEAVMATADGEVTTGLMSADRWLKENRLLPVGFDPIRASDRIRVRGAAATDPDFVAGSDVVRYSVDTAAAAGPYTIDVELWFQPIAYRWAENLSGYESFETQRFVRYFREMAGASAIRLAEASLSVP